MAEGCAMQIIYNSGASITREYIEKGNLPDKRYDIFVENVAGASLDTTDVAGTYAVTLPEGKNFAYAYPVDSDGNYTGDSTLYFGVDTITVGALGSYKVCFVEALSDITLEAANGSNVFEGWTVASNDGVSGTLAAHFTQENSELLPILGAQIRMTDGANDLRFVMQIAKSDLANVFGVSYDESAPAFGSVVLPLDMLGGKLTVTCDSYLSKDAYAFNIFEETDEYYLYTVCITGISDLSRSYTVRTFINTAGGTVYGESYTTSVISVAQAAYDAHNDPEDTRKLTDEELSVINSILGK